MVRLSIVVPVFNSEDCLDALVGRISSVLGRMSYELILVNDASRDASWPAIVRLAAADRRVVGINLRRNFGQDNALMAGLHAARGGYVVIMDDDLQHDPADIPALLAEADKGYDVVYARFREKKQAWWKNFGSWLNGKLAEWLLEKPRHIYLSPFKIIRREVVGEVIRYDGPYPYIDGLLYVSTNSFGQIDVAHHKRHSGRSNYNLVRSLRVFFKLATSFSIQPLRTISYLGFASAAAGILLAIFFFVEYLVSQQSRVVDGWTALVLIMLTLGGLILIGIGMLGEYLGRAYMNINRKPQFIVRETTGRGAGGKGGRR